MLHKYRFFPLLLAAILLFSVLPQQAFAEDSGNTASLLTSFCSDDHLELSISGTRLTVAGTISCSGLEKVCAVCKTVSGKELNRQHKNTGSGKRFSMTLGLSGTEDIDLSVYTFVRGETMGWSYEWGRITIGKEASGYVFKKGTVLENNNAFTSAWINPAEWNDAEVTEDIRTLSDSIVGTVKDDYAKCFLLNKWVAENIYYDYDNYYGKSQRTSLDPEDVLLSHKSVCAGYARLLTDLILAQGIPAFDASVYALGESTNGGSFARGAAAGTEPNHAITEAFVNGRWIIMDPTWDSNNKYSDGSYEKVATNGFYYFDITPEAFALDHQYFDRGPLTLQEGTVVNATESSRIPSSWAQELILSAIGEGIVPEAFQKYYSAPISRASMCALAVNMIQAKTGKTIGAFLSDQKKTLSGSLFADTTDSNVLACKALGIVDGKGKDSTGRDLFKPEDTLTRAQAAVISAKLAGLFGEETDGFENTFPDAAGHWSAPYLGWASSAGILSGTANGNFNPDGTLTLEQAIIIIYKTMKDTAE